MSKDSGHHREGRSVRLNPLFAYKDKGNAAPSDEVKGDAAPNVEGYDDIYPPPATSGASRPRGILFDVAYTLGTMGEFLSRLNVFGSDDASPALDSNSGIPQALDHDECEDGQQQCKPVTGNIAPDEDMPEDNNAETEESSWLK